MPWSGSFGSRGGNNTFYQPTAYELYLTYLVLRDAMRLLAFLFLTISCLGFAPKPSLTSELLVGTWVSPNNGTEVLADGNNRLVFTKTTCTVYDKGFREIMQYLISNKPTQCDTKIAVKKHVAYLQLLGNESGLSPSCHEIIRLDTAILALRPVGDTDVLVFKRKK